MDALLEQAEGLAEDVNAVWGRSNARAMALEEFSKLSKEERFLAVQTTNVGMFPRTEETLIEDEAFYKRIHKVYGIGGESRGQSLQRPADAALSGNHRL